MKTELESRFLSGLAGNAVAYRRFLTELADHLRHSLMQETTLHQGDVETVLQDILTAVHDARHTYGRDQRLAAWLDAIRLYKIADFNRQRRLYSPLKYDDQHG